MEVRLTDREWELISSHLSPPPRKRTRPRGRPRASDREILEGILWVLVTGSRWRDLPSGLYPAKSSCHRRFQTWSRDGSWQKVQRDLVQRLTYRGKIDLKEAFIDGSGIKAKKGVRSPPISEVRKSVPEKALF